MGFQSMCLRYADRVVSGVLTAASAINPNLFATATNAAASAPAKSSLRVNIIFYLQIFFLRTIRITLQVKVQSVESFQVLSEELSLQVREEELVTLLWL